MPLVERRGGEVYPTVSPDDTLEERVPCVEFTALVQNKFRDFHTRCPELGWPVFICVSHTQDACTGVDGISICTRLADVTFRISFVIEVDFNHGIKKEGPDLC